MWYGFTINLYILVINLPIYDGFYICKKLRKELDITIIVVTSSKSDIDELEIMNLGADDFITKLFNPRILLAHISSVLRMCYGNSNSLIISHNGAVLDVLRGHVSHDGKSIELTKTELGILKLLIENSANIIPRNAILSSLWEMSEFVEDNTLTVNVNRLRKN